MPGMLSRWPATAAVACLIVAMSEVPGPALPPVTLFAHADKAAHGIEYLVLGVLLFRSVRHESSGHVWVAAIITVFAGTLFGALDEWHQTFTCRTAEAWDVAADAAGLLAGTACVMAASEWRKRHGG